MREREKGDSVMVQTSEERRVVGRQKKKTQQIFFFCCVYGRCVGLILSLYMVCVLFSVLQDTTTEILIFI